MLRRRDFLQSAALFSTLSATGRLIVVTDPLTGAFLRDIAVVAGSALLVLCLGAVTLRRLPGVGTKSGATSGGGVSTGGPTGDGPGTES